MPRGAGTPDPRVWAATGGGGAGASNADFSNCYGRNMAKQADIASTGTYFGDVGGRHESAGQTERAAQEINAADRARERGDIDWAARDIRVAAAKIRATGGKATAAAPSGSGRPRAPRATRGYDGRVIKTNELDGICNQPPRGPVYCKRTWPGGFKGNDANGNPPGDEWVPATEQLADITVRDARTGKETVVHISRLIPGPDCFPHGQPWWTRSGAWVTRVAMGAGNEIGEVIREAGRDTARRVRALASGSLANIAAASVQSTLGTPAPNTGTLYCKTAWPGGIIGVPAGQPPPPGPWVPYGDGSACFHAG